MNNTKTKTKSYLFAAIGFLLTLALDQWTKYLASTILRRLESFSLISGVFELRYLENRGAAYLCCTACIRSCGKYDRSCET